MYMPGFALEIGTPAILGAMLCVLGLCRRPDRPLTSSSFAPLVFCEETIQFLWNIFGHTLRRNARVPYCAISNVRASSAPIVALGRPTASLPLDTHFSGRGKP